MIDKEGYKYILLFGSQSYDGGNMEAHCSRGDIYEDKSNAALAMIVKMARKRENEKEMEDGDIPLLGGSCEKIDKLNKQIAGLNEEE